MRLRKKKIENIYHKYIYLNNIDLSGVERLNKYFDDAETGVKEIIANNIVEKARALSQYDTPDDAFEGVKFVCGELNGAYAQYYPKWFRFKDEHIADFGVLVTSSNNTAVENISKEKNYTYISKFIK